MLLDHVFITYNDGVYNENTKTYDQIDPRILAYTKDSLLFDTKRHTIYAQGIEFGYSYTFPYVNSGVGITGTDISKGVAYYITGIEQNIDGSISYSYSYSYITFGLSDGVLDNNTGGSYITGMSMSEDGKISYKYANVNHTTNNEQITPSTQGIIIGANIDQAGNFTYQWYDATMTDSDKSGDNTTHEISGGEKQVLDGIYQDSFGKISYHWTTIGASHGGSINQSSVGAFGTNGDFISYAYLTSGGMLLGNVGKFTNEWSKNSSTSYISYVYIGHDGKLAYKYADVNHTTTPSNVTSLSKTGKGVIINADLDKAGNFTYDWYDASVSSGVKGNDLTLSNAKVQVLTGITQSSYGQISYQYSDINLNHTYTKHQRTAHQSHVITNVNIDANGNLAYDYTALKAEKTIADGSYTLSNTAQGTFITYIHQNSDGCIDYGVSTIKTDFKHNGDNVTGPVYDLSIDGNGHISYIHKNLSGNTGTYINALTYNKGTHVSYVAGSYIPFVSGISQDADGKISYTYSAIYTDAENNYRYHEINIPERTSTTQDPQENTVEVLRTIVTTNGNAIKHDISYTTVQVATKKYVDNLMTENDALRYAGTITPSSTANGTVTFSKNDYSTGAVYKVSGNGYFGIEYVTGGDMVISYSDSANATSFANWNVINNNIDLRTNDNVNSKNSNDIKKVITNVYLNDSGLLSYTTYNIGAQVVSNNDGASNELLGNTYTVITGINLEQDGLDTKLSYNYTTIKVNANHHSTSPNGTHHDQIISYVWLDKSGQLTYSAENLSSTAATPTSATLTNSNKYLVISSISQAANGKISYTAYELNTTHYNTNATNGTSSSVIGNVHLDANGTLSYSYVNIAQAAYHYAVNTNKVGDGNIISSIVVDGHGHVTTISYNSIAPTDEYVKFDKVTNKNIYLSGTDTQNGDVTVHSYIDGITYVNNGTIFMEKAIVGNSSDDTISINAKAVTFNEDSTHFDFTGLKALWGVIQI